MKNVIIAALGTYIFYGFCEVRFFLLPFLVFIVFWLIVVAIDEEIKDYRRKIRRGKKLSKLIDKTKGVYHE